MKSLLQLLNNETGHAAALPGAMIGMVGAILLAIGAVNDQDVLTIIGAIVLAVGLLATSLLQHIGIDYEVYSRLEKLEGDD